MLRNLIEGGIEYKEIETRYESGGEAYRISTNYGIIGGVNVAGKVSAPKFEEYKEQMEKAEKSFEKLQKALEDQLEVDQDILERVIRL